MNFAASSPLSSILTSGTSTPCLDARPWVNHLLLFAATPTPLRYHVSGLDRKHHTFYL